MRIVLVISMVLAIIGVIVLISTKSEPDTEEPAAEVVAALPSSPSPAVKKLCSTCHKLPPPDCEPRLSWPQKITQMYEYMQGDRPWPETYIPPIEEPIAYFTAQAPEYLPLPDDVTGSPPSPLEFGRHEIALADVPSWPATSNVKFVRFSETSPLQLLISDMRHGIVAVWDPSHPGESARTIAKIPHPSRTTLVDLDQDGILDILVADLGVFWNIDSYDGTVVWLRGRGDGGFQSFVLADHLSRPNEAQAADFDGDGDLDIVVGAFGNFTTGMVAYLENFTEDYSKPEFEVSVVEGRTGTSDVRIEDLNHDGRPDFVALQSQQYEEVVAFLNVGWGRFEKLTIHAAPHPRWGSTGIKLADWDGDGDTDVLLNHGDALQRSPVLRPYHGFGWLENDGHYPYTYHRLAHLPGAHTSQPVDMDGDGDWDIVSSVFMPAFAPNRPIAQTIETTIWLEQAGPGQYRRYVLESGMATHACLDAADFDNDGDIDIALGNFALIPEDGAYSPPSVTILENRSSRVATPGPQVANPSLAE